MFNLPPIDASRYFAWLSKGLNAENILKWLGDVDHIFRWHKSYNDAICLIAEETGTPLVDVRSDFFKTPDFREYLCDDGIHPNSKGHRLIFETVSRFASSIAPTILA
jgi:hypothetical protein